MNNYKSLFSLPDNIHYINGAYMSPILKETSEAGRLAISKKENPTLLSPEDFFLPVVQAKESYGKLINASSEQITLLPAASYGFANAFNNISPKGRTKAICVGAEFPSGYFTLLKWCQEHNLRLEVVKKPESNKNRSSFWQQEIIDAIDENTGVVLISAIHWMDGTKYNLKSIGEKCLAHNIPLFVDGTQAVGATPIDVQAFNISALINPSYKWLLGPYGLGFAYYAPSFNEGIPLEESWMNREKAVDFSNLTDYNEQYQPGASRYDVGESSSFIHLAMMQTGVDFVNNFGVKKIKNHCAQIVEPLCNYLRENEFWLAEDAYRAPHLFGFELPDHINMENLKKELASRKVYLSFRKNSIRVSPNIYNNDEDIQVLIESLQKVNS